MKNDETEPETADFLDAAQARIEFDREVEAATEDILSRTGHLPISGPGGSAERMREALADPGLTAAQRAALEMLTGVTARRATEKAEAERVEAEFQERTGGRFNQKVKPPTGKPDTATQLATWALEQLDAELWHTPEGETFVTLLQEEHQENIPVRTRAFRRWLSNLYYNSSGGKAPNSQAVEAALNLIDSRAAIAGVERPAPVRLAGRNGKIYLDLADSEWRAVEVTADGWEVVRNPPVRFRRADHMEALPVPTHGGSFDDLRRFTNVTDDGDWELIKGYLVMCLFPFDGAYPILLLNGGQGSAKTTTARVIRALIDPNGGSLRAVPRDERGLLIAARNGLVIGFDNVSALPDWLSDACCRLATGSASSERTLYTDDEEHLFKGRRPLLITGIEDVATRPDFLDRSMTLTLTPIEEAARRPEGDLWREFEAARPAILGALLDAAVSGLRHRGEPMPGGLPRMADFAQWASAALDGGADGPFMRAYRDNILAANALALEASPVADAILKWMREKPRWEGTATALLEHLNSDVKPSIDVQRTNAWPKNATKLSGAVKRIMQGLRGAGVEVTFTRVTEGGATSRRIRLSRLATEPSIRGAGRGAKSTRDGAHRRYDATDAKKPNRLQVSH